MIRTVAVLIAAGLLATPLVGGEPVSKKILGTWSRTKDDAKFQFKFTADTVTFMADGPLGKLELDGDYGITKEGSVYGRIRKVREGAGPTAGELFGFTVGVKGEVLTISDWRGSGGVALATFLQGEYKKGEAK